MSTSLLKAQNALSIIEELLMRFDSRWSDTERSSKSKSMTNCSAIRCSQCNAVLLNVNAATSVNRNKYVKIHEYNGQNMEKVNKFWKVDKLTNFENISVSKPVTFAKDHEINEIISILMEEPYKDLKSLQLRYLMCSGPSVDLSGLFAKNQTQEQSKNIQSLLTKSHECEKLIIGCAVFDDKDYKSGYIVRGRVVD